MKLSFLMAVAVLFLSACVTETKPEENKPYVTTVPAQIPEKPPTPAQVAKSDSIPGYLVVKCRIQNDKTKKLSFCGPTTVKLTNELTKNTIEHTFKGDRTALNIGYDSSYIVEISTKGCEATRKFAGMTSGMGITAQYDNCGAVK